MPDRDFQPSGKGSSSGLEISRMSGFWFPGGRSEITRMATSVQRPTPPLRLPGLNPKFSYRVAELLPDGVDTSVRISGNLQVPWWGRGLTLAGSALAGAGIRFPDLDPERTLLLSITATEIPIR